MSSTFLPAVVGSTMDMNGPSALVVRGDGAPAPRGDRRGPRALSLGRLYDAANRADFRGYIYIPSLSPAEQLDNLTLSALRDRTEVLYANGGAPRMLIDRLSMAEAGTGIWPKWVTGQEDFDKAATDAYHYANHDPRVFSANGRDDGYSVQYAIRRCIARYGDCFGQLLRPSPGATQPQMSLIPGYQCMNPNNSTRSDGWVDGVRMNALGRPIEYCFVTRDASGKRAESRVPADDVLHFHDPFMPGQVRGEPCLAPVAKKLFRREDIAKAMANGTLTRERLGFALEYKDGAEGGPSLAELTGDGDDQETTDEEAAEKPADVNAVTLRKVFGSQADEDILIPKLPNGTRIAPVESNRPGTAVMEYQDAILKEGCWARLYPAEYLFFMAGIGQGTVSRAVLMAASEVIVSRRELQMRPQFCSRHPIFWVWQMIKGGYFERLRVPVKVPDNWWQTKNVHPMLPGVDIAREGNLHDNRVATGKESIELYHGVQGDDASDVEDENVNAIRRRFKKLKALNTELEKDGFPPLKYEDLWSRSINVPMQQAATPPGQQPPQE